MLTNWIIGVFLIVTVGGTLDPAGTKCGQKRCTTTEYCSPYDTQCRPCTAACDTSSHNYQPEICVKDCQEFLHDQRYVLRGELGRDVVSRDNGQAVQTRVALILSLISLVGVILLYLWTFLRGKKLRGAWKKICGTKWTKKKINNNKIRDDVEAGPPKQQNVLKLTMPTISRSVAAASQGTTGTNVSTSSTPNTTSTPLSRRHPSEDTTLDYAYDNPAMTPSPETAPAKTKKESSF
ncbi:protein grindelwald [Diachasma alloeum]|uniref:protein grindelwald n=1 Tax=Diachasma alloeum TaxID=454923 RepID=UPI0007383FBE|nr:protein grindelwald [Diachasma alloeum]